MGMSKNREKVLTSFMDGPFPVLFFTRPYPASEIYESSQGCVYHLVKTCASNNFLSASFYFLIVRDATCLLPFRGMFLIMKNETSGLLQGVSRQTFIHNRSNFKIYFKLIESKAVDTKKLLQSLWLSFFIFVFTNRIRGRKLK